MIRDSKIQTESLVAGAESPLVSTYSFSKPLSSKFRLLVFLIHEGQGRTPLLIHEGPLRGTKNGNCRTATATSFCPRRATKGHEERQRQHLCPRRTRRAAENGNCRTATATSFCPRRATKDREVHLYLSTKDTKGHEERQRQHLCPRRTRRAAENGNCRTATATSFCPRRATKGREEHLF